MPADALTLAAMIVLTISAYALARGLYRRYRHPLVQPVFLGASLIIIALLVSGRGFDDYRSTQDALSWFLGPVTVALAVPALAQANEVTKWNEIGRASCRERV